MDYGQIRNLWKKINISLFLRKIGVKFRFTIIWLLTHNHNLYFVHLLYAIVFDQIETVYILFLIVKYLLKLTNFN